MIRKETPDELLERLKYEESINSRGRLKIFFGYAAGVGKTYAMLSAAHDLKKQGIQRSSAQARAWHQHFKES